MPPEVLDLFTELAAVPSPPGEERAVADLVVGYLRDCGLEVDEDGCVVVRPDMYVAWRARQATSKASDVLVEVFGKLLGRIDSSSDRGSASVAAE